MSEPIRLAITEPPALGVSADVLFQESRAETTELSDPVLTGAVTSGSMLVERFRVLRAKVESIDQERGLRRIGVIAATPGEGATTTAVALATSLAREGSRRVLLVEADLKHPVLADRLGVPATRGLSDWLARGAEGPVMVRPINPLGVFLLTSGSSRPEPGLLLETPGLARLLDSARSRFDFTVVDCPPLSTGADSVLIQDVLDGFVMVVRSRAASREQIQQALSQLKPDRVQGVVFNDHHEILGRRFNRTRRRRG